MKTESWKPIPLFDGYFISNFGNVKSYRYQKGLGNGNGTVAYIDLAREGNLLKGIEQIGGYIRVCIYMDKKKHYKSVHRLVMKTFVGDCPKGEVVCHLDGNPKNNRLDNLIYGTPTENQSHRLIHGTDGNGEKNGFSKLKLKDVLFIRKFYKRFDPKFGGTALAKKYGVTVANISSIIHFKSWRLAS